MSKATVLFKGKEMKEDKVMNFCDWVYWDFSD